MMGIRQRLLDLTVVALGIVLPCELKLRADGLRIYVSNEDSGEITLDGPAAGQVLQLSASANAPVT
jgi:hypothetical protein